MVLQEFFTEAEITMIVEALEVQEQKWIRVSKSPIKGFGRASEYQLKEDRAILAEEYTDLLSKITEYTT